MSRVASLCIIVSLARGTVGWVPAAARSRAVRRKSRPSLLLLDAPSFRVPLTTTTTTSLRAAVGEESGGDDDDDDGREALADRQRRALWKKTAVRVASAATAVGAVVALATRPARASPTRSRTEGYAVQKTEREWRAALSPLQYDILRRGGTEPPGFSILEGEARPGVFRCAGCGTALFVAGDKFKSGTGWPSFARSAPGNNVEVERVGPIAANLSGAELRCRTCGGHLGDVFNDGFLFRGTEAAVTGKRFCIDGAALVFYPDSGEDPVRGDVPAAPRGGSMKLPSFLEPPEITPRDK